MKKVVNKPRCSGQWTEAQFTTFVKNQLRGATWKWKPVSDVLKAARETRGWYLCAGCNQSVPASRDKKKNVFVDHVQPIVDPIKGFTTWDDFVNKLFCEVDNLQLLCRDCHDKKSTEERKLAVERRKKIKSGSI
jgi:5-methylcytosine-specific restriction endonuclease McrA